MPGATNLRPSVIWNTIQNDLPPLVARLAKLLSEPNE